MILTIFLTTLATLQGFLPLPISAKTQIPYFIDFLCFPWVCAQSLGALLKFKIPPHAVCPILVLWDGMEKQPNF